MVANAQSYPWQCADCKECNVCGSKGDEIKLLFCDKCDYGTHCYCLDPPLKQPPDDAWVCPDCERGDMPCNRNKRNRQGSEGIRATASPTVNSPKPLPSALRASQPSQSNGARANGVKHRREASTPADSTNKRRRSMSQDNSALNLHSGNESEVRVRPKIIKLKLSSGQRGKSGASTSVATPKDQPKRRRRPAAGAGGSTPGRRQRHSDQAPPIPPSEDEEPPVPFGGVITGADADTSRTTVTLQDSEMFDRSRRAADTCLGAADDDDSSVPRDAVTPARSETGSLIHFPAVDDRTLGNEHPSMLRSLRDRSQLQVTASPQPVAFDATGGARPTETNSVARKISTIRFGQFDIDTWYSAPYPEEYAKVPDGRLWLCKFCLKYMKSGFVAERHEMKCKARCPPGDEIYRDGAISVFEVDGRKNKVGVG